MPSFLEQPWQIQVALASGYAAYILAYTGIRDHHRALDTTFGTLVFSLIASAILALSYSVLSSVLSGALAFCSACVAGLIWRHWGRRLLRAALRGPDVSWSDADPSAWATLTADTRNYVSQIAVLTDDGTWLRCDNTALFSDAPFGPCRLGPTGDAALYLTHIQLPSGEVRDQTSARNADYGDLITHIPAARIKRMTVRHIPR
jgi:hypothetical protein